MTNDTMSIILATVATLFKLIKVCAYSRACLAILTQEVYN